MIRNVAVSFWVDESSMLRIGVQAEHEAAYANQHMQPGIFANFTIAVLCLTSS